MSWKENLRPASFRGVSFFIDTSEFTTGRRVSLHEYPDREFGFPEDLGKISRTFKVDGHILGDDYFQTKQSMIEAVETPGVGELIHPYFGTVQVQVNSFAINEDTGRGRIASISFMFYESGDDRFPKNVQDKQSTLEARSGSAIESSKENFDDNFSIVRQPGFVVDAARDKVQKAADLFTESTQGVVTVSEEASNLAFGIRNLTAEVDDLLQSPSDLSNRLLDSFQLLEDSIPSSEDRLSVIGNFTTFGDDDAQVLGTTPSRDRQRDNNSAFNSFIKQVAASKSALYASQVEFDSTNEANEKRQEISALINEQIQSTENDDVFQQFRALNAVLIKTVPDEDADIPNIENVTPNDTTNSLVLVYDLFERRDSEQDIIDRNKIKNPAVIEQGIELEVIDVRRS